MVSFDHPAMFAIPLALVAGVLASIDSPSKSAAIRFARMYRQLFSGQNGPMPIE